MKTTITFLSLVLCLSLSLPLALAQDRPVNLHLAIFDDVGRASEPYVLEFIEQVETLSDGNIRILPMWNVSGGDEELVIQLILLHTYELGLVASRAWDLVGVTSFQALQAPFLITNDALAESVAGSDIAAQMLEGLASAGIVGLALWPEDLRHPFAFEPSGKTFLAPEDLAGTTIRAPPSDVTWALLEALRATPMFKNGYGPDVESGLIQGAESGFSQGASLTVAATATGNVTFFPKFQVLFADGEALAGLSEEQRAILRDAATATQEKAIAEHPREVDEAAAWCADSGSTIMLASEEQVAAFEKAAQPIFDQIKEDPQNAELIAAIRDLKANTPASPEAEACGQ